MKPWHPCHYVLVAKEPWHVCHYLLVAKDTL
jgi:hypothetical protein